MPGSPHVIATNYWAAHLGCAPEELFTEPFRIVPHGNELADYNGVFALFRDDKAIASIPGDRTAPLLGLLQLHTGVHSPQSLAFALGPVATKLVGPAWIGYADAAPAPLNSARALAVDDADALRSLQQACDPMEWDDGGSTIDQPCSGVFAGGQLAALAGYEVWGGTIAHLYVITHPAFRGRGYGRSAVAHLAARALAAGLLPQYRTLQANVSSIRIAQALGFEPYATSMAVRL
jgi:GNAT superfamily N-acetyltransferase